MEATRVTPEETASIPNEPVRWEGESEPLIDFDVRRLVAILRRNRLWIVAIVVASMLAGLIITMLMIPRYTASTTLMIEQESDQIIENSEIAPTASYQDADRFLQTQLGVIRSRGLAERVVDAERLASDPRFFEAMGAEMPAEADLAGIYDRAGGLQDLRRDTALDLLQEYLSVTLPGESRLAEIKFESNDPVLSAKIANAFAVNAIESNLGRKFESSAYARQFLAQQLGEVRQRLEESERELNQYSRVAGLIRVAGQGQNADQETTLSVTNDTLVQVNLAASQATAERIAAQDKWQNVANTPVLSVPQVLANPAAQDLIRQKGQALAALAQERALHLDEHPTVQALQAQVEQLDAQIDSIGNSIKRSVYLDYQAAADKERSLKGQVGSLQSTALTEQDRGVQYNVLKRVADTNRALYDTLLERYNALNATAGAASNNLSLVDQADIPRQPSSPKLFLNLALAFLAGLALAVLFIFVREHLDDVIRAPDDVEAKLGLPLLGLVPASDESELDSLRDDMKSDVGEAYHSLVANLRYSTVSGLPSSLVVTSAQAAEGKTTSAGAIASHLARLGHSVLLIDADLRRPTLHRVLGRGALPGLTDVLTGQAKFKEVIHPSQQPNLSLMTALPIPPDPSTILGSPRLGEILREAQDNFDIVILDSPPLLGLSDTPNLAAEAEAVILVIDASQGHRGAVKAALRRLQLVHANVLGAVLTKFDPKALGSGYSYYGYQYYRYGDDKAEMA